LSGKGIQVLLTGHCGPNAHETLSAAGISVILGCSGSAREAVQQYRTGQLTASNGPNSVAHAGLEAQQTTPNDQVGQTRPSPPPAKGFGRGRGGAGGGGRRRQRQCSGGGRGRRQGTGQ